MYVWWRAVMLKREAMCCSYDEQTNKRSPTRLSGLFVKSEKEVYRRES